MAAHDTKTVQHTFRQSPFHQASWKKCEPMTLELWKMPTGLMTCELSSPISNDCLKL